MRSVPREVVDVQGRVALSATAAAMAECDAETVEGGKLTRRIPERTRRLVFERDGMACLVPDCGATHGLNFHHEGPAGWRSVGDDPDHVLLLCGAHHALRHEGWLTITGSASAGFCFHRHDGEEIVARRAAVAVDGAHVRDPAPTVDGARVRDPGPAVSAAVKPADGAHVRDAGEAEVDTLAELTLRALELGEQEARGAIQRARAQATGPLTVEELVTLVLRGLPAG